MLAVFDEELTRVASGDIHASRRRRRGNMTARKFLFPQHESVTLWGTSLPEEGRKQALKFTKVIPSQHTTQCATLPGRNRRPANNSCRVKTYGRLVIGSRGITEAWAAQGTPNGDGLETSLVLEGRAARSKKTNRITSRDVSRLAEKIRELATATAQSGTAHPAEMQRSSRRLNSKIRSTTSKSYTTDEKSRSSDSRPARSAGRSIIWDGQSTAGAISTSKATCVTASRRLADSLCGHRTMV